MIDGIGKAGGGRLELVRSSGRPVEAGKSDGAGPNRTAGAPASPIAAMAAEGAPIDSSRIAAIRTAIAEGRYPVDPGRIAAAMVDIDLPLFDGQ